MVVSIVILIIYDPLGDPSNLFQSVWRLIDIFCTFIFILEALIKIFALGFFMTSLRGSGQRSYIRNVWNVLDFIILITTLFYLKEETDYLSFYYSGKNKLTDLSELEMKTSISNLRVFRVLRVLRPLRMINRFVGLKLVMNTVISSIFPMLNVLLILFLEILLFSIIGQSLYSNTFSHCVINGDIYLAREDDRIITSQDCIDLGYKWQNAPFNFDNIISGI